VVFCYQDSFSDFFFGFFRGYGGQRLTPMKKYREIPFKIQGYTYLSW
jgi:hypothetical protein